MTESTFELAQVNIGRARGEMTDPVMAEFVGRLAEINVLADASPGFVWRLQTEDGDATLWWVPAGHRPTVGEAVGRLAHLEQHGPTAFAFSFASPFGSSGRPVRHDDVNREDACPTT
ncbi:MAG: DUF3291 domain-containing protein [Gemmatimonadales bacterium]